jgi:large subunit ribosomal protein L15
MKRKKKKVGKWRGLRTHGAGNVKNRRGSGNRGGRGNAGYCKHKFTWVTRYKPDYFGKHGFVPPRRKDVETINLFEINRKALFNELEKRDEKFYFEFKGKVLGTGELSVPVVIKALEWSKKAEEKVKKCGGELIKMMPSTQAEKSSIGEAA